MATAEAVGAYFEDVVQVGPRVAVVVRTGVHGGELVGHWWFSRGLCERE